MERKTFYITPSQLQWLEQQADRRELTLSETLRRVLDAYIAGQEQ